MGADQQAPLLESDSKRVRVLGAASADQINMSGADDEAEMKARIGGITSSADTPDTRTMEAAGQIIGQANKPHADGT